MAEIVGSLLDKLTDLLHGEADKLNGIEDDVSFFKDELCAMKAALEDLELRDTPLDPLTKDWRDHVRETAYDIKDCVDDAMRNLGGAHANAGVVQKIAQFVQMLWTRHQIAGQFKALRARVVETNDRRKRYKLDDCKPGSSSYVAVDPRMSAIYKEAAGLVGMDGPREKLVSWLNGSDKKLKVVSIVGSGGLGKTTLAKHVYDEIGGQFDCKAFVSVSQRPDMTHLLSSLQLRLNIGEEEPSCARGVQHIIDCLREQLTHKRYLIVVDDLWDCSAWNTISWAFPENGTGSRVIVTTRVDDVARGVCHNHHAYIYRMEPLQFQDSRRLFLNRVFGSAASCPSQFEEIADETLKKSGGLPLAIITISSLLASCQTISMNEWENIRNSLGAKFAINPTLEEMRSILNLSYMHLPLHLRACLLCLGMYPEDHTIIRDELIRLWIAEGFVSNSHGPNLVDVAKSYFNVLINRSMIQPESTEYGEVSSCRVHDMMLDLIQSKCTEDNFISVAYNNEDVARLHGRKYKVRRLSLNSISGSAESTETIATSLSQVRSFARFGESRYTLPLSLFNYLRVLIFEFPYNWDMNVDLTAIGQLFQLRYLQVSAVSGSIDLPTEIRELVHLETLLIFSESVQSIPSDIVLLSRLSCLVLPDETGLPEGIGSMKSLHILQCSHLSGSLLEDIKGLGELVNLRELMLYDDALVEEIIEALIYSIGKLRKLRLLRLEYKSSKQDDCQLYSLSNPPLHVENIYLDGPMFKRVPKWMGDLGCLRSLTVCVEHLSTADVHVLGKLPSLIELTLWVLRVAGDSAAIICMGLFPVLEVLKLKSRDDDATTCMEFQTGAIPKLRQLDLTLYGRWGGAVPVGMEHLLALEQMSVHISRYEVFDVKCAFEKAIEVHPRRPSVMICKELAAAADGST